jgi:hypothetical protein
MELLEKIIFFVVAIVCILVLIGMAWNFLKIPGSQTEVKIQGDKATIISRINNLIYKCFEDNEGARVSIVCFQVDFKSDGGISSSDILNKISNSRIDKNNVVVDDLGLSGKIIIRYENQSIYVRKVGSEGIEGVSS